MVVNPAKMAEPIEMLIGMMSGVGPRKHVLDGDPDLLMCKGYFGGKWTAHCKV